MADIRVVSCELSARRQIPAQSKGREPGLAALPEGHGGERRKALAEQHPEQGVMGVVGLDHDLARVLGASGTARDLDELLGHALAGPEVGAVKPLIAVHDRDQGDLREVVALGSIWVPTRMSASPSAIRASTRSQAAWPRTESRSMRSTRAAGKCSCSDSTTRSVPCPTLHRKTLPHSAQPIGTGRSAPQ